MFASSMTWCARATSRNAPQPRGVGSLGRRTDRHVWIGWFVAQPAVSSTSTTAVGFRSERGPVLGSVMLSTGLVAIDSTVLATAVPSIVGEFGGFHQFPWLFSAYLLGQAVTTPIYAKLSDVFGRKPILLLGIALFLLGSILCAAAWNMLALIVFRAIQGLEIGRAHV